MSPTLLPDTFTTSRKSIFSQSLPSRERLLELCRVCGQSRNETRCFSALQEGVVREHLLTYLNIQVLEEGLPHLVCPTCAQVLIDWDFVVKTSLAFELALAAVSASAAAKTEADDVELCDSEAVLGTENQELCDSAAVLGTENQELCDSAAVLGTETQELCNSAAVLGTENQELCDSAAVLGTENQELCDSAAVLGTGNQELCNSAGLDTIHINNSNCVDDTIIPDDAVSYSTAVLGTEKQELSCSEAILGAENQELFNSAVLNSIHIDNANCVENKPVTVDEVSYSAAIIGTEKQELSYSAAEIDTEICGSAVDLLGQNCYTAEVKTEVERDCDSTAQELQVTTEVNNAEMLSIKREQLEELFENAVIPMTDPELPSQNDVDPIHIPTIKPEPTICNEQFVIENPVPPAKRGPGRPRIHPLPPGYVPRKRNKKVSKYKTITTKQLTFNLNNSNDVSKISQFQQVHVVLEPVQLKQTESTDNECEIVNTVNITNLKSNLRASLRSNVQPQQCILCKRNVTNFLEHLEDSHIENRLVNQILNEYNSNIQNKILNCVLTQRKLQRIIGHVDSVKTTNDQDILYIESIQQLCFNKIIDLLPEHIRTVIKRDRIVSRYGVRIIEKLSVSNSNLFISVSHNLKQLVKILMHAQQANPNVTSMASLLTEEHCWLIFDSLRLMGGYNSRKYKNPGLVKQIGRAIKLCAKIQIRLEPGYRAQFPAFNETFTSLYEGELELAKNSMIGKSVNIRYKRKAVKMMTRGMCKVRKIDDGSAIVKVELDI